MNPRKTALALGTAAALTLAASGAVPAAAAGPCAQVSSTCSPADVAKDHAGEKTADVKAGVKAGVRTDVRTDVRKDPGGGKPRDGRPGCGPEKTDHPGKPGKPDNKDNGISQEAFAKALAAELGVGYDRALRAVKELDALTEKGRVDPDSAGFGAVAEHLGVTPDRLEQALRNVKRALAGAEPA
ncbi:hypothetical protein ACFYUV_48535 [Nonomuraea sp. NPDC003560]|uniref:hypothetical protein n=1 Tax=Nonomuraea sp. NPDC003560 TaxID=3364341 RepID=UPI0036776104